MKRNFIKYPSLENHYNVTKSRKIMNVINELFYATEKLHGANISIEITNDNTRYLSRNEEFELGRDGFGKLLTKAKNLPLIREIGKSLLSDKINKVIIFGELYGAGIQKMDYIENIENRREYRIFDVFIFENDKAYTLPIEDVLFLFDLDLIVPIKEEVKTLKEWLNTPLPEKSALGGDIEGLVYKPVNGQVLSFEKESGSVDNYIGVKHKTEKFAEVKKAKTKKMAEWTPNEINFKDDIERYFTRRRLDNLVSKGDMFALSIKNLGNIIPAFLEDVKTDYLKDNGSDVYFNDRVFNKMAGNVAKLVKEVLAE